MAFKYFAFTIFFVTKFISISCKQYGSLSLVIDDTLSMRQEIDSIKRESSQFMHIILTQSSSQISDVVVVTFNDPEQSNLRLKPTKDKNEVMKALGEIHVDNNRTGGDCPEYSLTGINTALNNSRQNSFLFVFTDASPKEGYVQKKNKFGKVSWKLKTTLQNEEIARVKNNAQLKETQIFFFLTKAPTCNEPSKLFEPYWEIAAKTNGQVFKINDKKDLEEFLKYMNILIEGETNVINIIEIKAGERVPIYFSVDSQTQFVIVSASSKGDEVFLNLTRGPTRTYEKITWTKNNKIIKIENPVPGNYSVEVEGTGNTTIRVAGRTDFTFQHGFSDIIPPMFSNENLQPVEGKEVHLLIKIADASNNVDIKTAQIKSPDGYKMFYSSLALKKVSDSYYATEQFVAPNDTFTITVIGEDKTTNEPNKHTIKRSAKTPIQPRLRHTDPVISIQGGGKHEYNTNVLLTCFVKAYPKPNITWIDDDGNILDSSLAQEIDKKYFVSKFNITNLKHNTKIYCYAENDKAELFKHQVDLQTLSPFIVNHETTTENVATEYGKPASLLCNITAAVPMEITWYHIVNNNYIELNNANVTHSEYIISNNGTKLTINKVNQEYAGQYICKASVSDDRETTYELLLNITIKHTAPIVRKSVDVKLNEDKSIILSCPISNGYPKPEITWEFQDYKSSTFRPLKKIGDQLQITNATHLSAGIYKCVATNDMGKNEHKTAVIINIRPKATLIVNAEKTVFTCNVISHSRPIIVWKNSKNEVITTSGEITKNNDYEYTSKMTTNMDRYTDTYHCEATNELSTTKSNIVHVDISNSKPLRKVRTSLDNYVNKVNYGEELSIPCGIVANHVLIKRTWYKHSTGEVIQSSRKYLVTGNGDTLIIKKVDNHTRGKYRCKASVISDEATQMTSDTTVDINLEKPQVEAKHRDLEIFRDEEAVLKCKVQRGFPKPAITWMVKYEKTSEFIALPEVGEELKLSPVLYSHAGLYKCVLKNNVGSDETTFKLIVEGLPEILTDSDQVYTAAVGDDELVIPCEVAGYPKPHITWKCDLPSKTQFEVDSNGSLIVKNPKIEDSGKKCVCTVANEFGTAEKDFTTFVNRYPDNFSTSVLSPRRQ